MDQTTTEMPQAADAAALAEGAALYEAGTCSKRPFVTKDQLEAIADAYPTPFYLYDEATIRSRVEALLDAFSWNPGFREYFAVKATPNPAIIRILLEYGCGLDCSSATELMLAEALGATGEKIMFSSNQTPAAEYARALGLGATINLDDPDHVAFLDGIVGEKGFPATMSCRYNPGGTFTLGGFAMGEPGESKFGMGEEQIERAFAQLAERGVRDFGIHAMLGSNTVTNDYYPELARGLFSLAKRLHERLGVHIAFVNLSGGVGVAYRPNEEPNDIAAIGAGVRRVYEEMLVPAGMGDVAIYTELGRWVTAPAGMLVTRATHLKHSWREYVGVDACSANLMRPAMYGAYHHVTVMGQAGGEDKSQAAATQTCDVVGMLCENSDKLAVQRVLPPVEVGDLLLVHDAGAHGHSMGYNYNGRLRSAEVLLRPDGSAQLIRRAETPADYFATLDVTPEGEALLAGGDDVKAARP